MKTMEKMKSAAMETAVKTALAYLERDPEANIPKMMKLVDQVCPDDWYVSQRKAVRGVIEQKNHWYDLMLKLYDLDAGVRKTFFTNFIINASLKGSARQIEASAEKTATCRGRSCSIRPRPATCIAPAAGRRNMAIS